MNDDTGHSDPILPRARKVVAGFADVGLTGAEELLRRMSPEGREQARRDRAAKARRQRRLMVRLAMATAASILIWAMFAVIGGPGVALAVATATMLLLATVIFLRADPRAPGREALHQAALPDLFAEADVWIAAHDRGLPPPALQLAGDIRHRLADLAPHIGQLDPRSPASAAIRKLVATELPDLIEGWRKVPLSARRMPLADGRTPDDHLLNGLQLVEAELARTCEEVGTCALNGIAVNGRYLELKYGRDDGLP